MSSISSSACMAYELCQFESEMLQRTASKVKASAEAAVFLYSDTTVFEGNITRGAAAATIATAAAASN